MLNVTKKAVSLLLIFILPVSFNACRYETRIDFSELIRRMNLGNNTYNAVTEEAFRTENEWFLFTDTLNENDLLITAKENEDKILTTASVSIVNNKAEEQKDIFFDFCRRLITAFTENENTEKIIEDSGISHIYSYTSDEAVFAENGRFLTSLYLSQTGCSFIISIKDYDPS